jgi:hypothetical protein
MSQVWIVAGTCDFLDRTHEDEALSGGEQRDEDEERYAADQDACWIALFASRNHKGLDNVIPFRRPRRSTYAVRSAGTNGLPSNGCRVSIGGRRRPSMPEQALPVGQDNPTTLGNCEHETWLSRHAL